MALQTLPFTYYTAEQAKALDRLVIEREGIPGFDLMHRAAKACFAVVKRLWPAKRRLLFFAGGGNNGGDAYLCAALAVQAGCQVLLYSLKAPDALSGDALRAAEYARAVGVDVRPFHETPFHKANVLEGYDLIVDGLLGTGFRGALKPLYRAAIDAMNGAAVPVLAIDLPSGLSANSGAVFDAAVRAEATVTLIGLKRGLLTADGPEYSGDVWFDDLGVPGEVYQSLDFGADRRCYGADPLTLRACLPVRQATDHKGRFGHLMTVGGNRGYLGAIIMASCAALRSGTGLVSLVTRPEHALIPLVQQPEIMAHGVDSRQALTPLLDGCNAVVLGPGLGQDAWSEMLLDAVVASDRPLVLDADALNIISARNLQDAVQGGGQNKRAYYNASERYVVMTPHPGEAARRLGCSVREVQQDRFSAVEAIAKQYGVVAVLKGAGTLVATPTSDAVFLNRTGNPGMASGGMGDVLAGLIGSFLAQGVPEYLAAKAAVALHGYAADLQAQRFGEVGMLATDLMPVIREVLNG